MKEYILVFYESFKLVLNDDGDRNDMVECQMLLCSLTLNISPETSFQINIFSFVLTHVLFKNISLYIVMYFTFLVNFVFSIV